MKTQTNKTMKTTIQNLKIQVQNAKTFESNGRQVIADTCKKLYNMIESELYARYGQAAINDAYSDLCNGNFSEPFLCEQKKQKFNLYASIFLG